MLRRSILLFAVMMGLQAHAATIEAPLADPLQEASARQVFSALKCVVCEGQSLADSDAKLAIQMRARIRTMAGQGQSPDAIMQFFRESYGDKILMQPPAQGAALAVWLLPILLLACGAYGIYRFTRPAHD